MGKQLYYLIDYSGFLQIAQVALDVGCMILPKKHTNQIPSPSGDLSVITEDCCSYWFYLPELAELEFIKDNAGRYYPNYSFNALGLAMIEAGFSRTKTQPSRLYVMSGYYDANGQWIPRSEQITSIYNQLSKALKKYRLGNGNTLL